MISKRGYHTIVSDFDSNWVPNTSGLVTDQYFIKLLIVPPVNEYHIYYSKDNPQDDVFQLLRVNKTFTFIKPIFQ